MFKHILVAVDFSPVWPLLKQRLETLAAWGTEQITFIYVLSSRYPATPEETHRSHYEHQLAELVQELSSLNVKIDSHVLTGEPGAVLVDEAKNRHVDLLLMGSKGHNRLHEFFLGSTALDAARLTQCPLWLEPNVEDAIVVEHNSLMMLATDGSDAVTGAEALAGKLAPYFERSVAVTATCASEGCDREIADAQSHLNSVSKHIKGLTTKILDGDPRQVIVAEAKQEQADLIVVGKRGRNRIQEFLLGSSAEAISRDAHCAVLVVPNP